MSPVRLLATSLLTLAIFGCVQPTVRPEFIGSTDSACLPDTLQIEYPDVERCDSPVVGTLPPRTMSDGEPTEFWDLPLDDAIRMALSQAAVLRDLGGRILSFPDAATTIYDPGISVSHPRLGPEAALAAFDAQVSETFLFTTSDRPFNSAIEGGNAFEVNRDGFAWNWELAKTAATGTQFNLRSGLNYEHNNDSPAPTLLFSHAWTNNIEASVRHPLLRGSGVAFNRIAGPTTSPDLSITRGVVLARIDADISLADFEQGVRDYVDQIESVYWELYQSYRVLDANRRARDSARATWQTVKARHDADLRGGEADQEAQAREQMYLFEQQVLVSLDGSPDSQVGNGLYRRERQLRLLLGLPVNDGRLIRPSDEPTEAPIRFDWDFCVADALVRRVELRRQMWRVKQRELELLAARNFLLPRLDAIAGYRLEGLGDDLIADSSPFAGSVNDMFTLEHYNIQAGLQLNVPLGYRRELAGVRHSELNLRRAQAVLEEQEHQIVHALGGAFAALDTSFSNAQLARQRLDAAEQVVDSRTATFESGRGTIDALLEAQRRLADARTAYHRAQTDHVLAIKELHKQKGTLLPYNGVQLAESSRERPPHRRLRELIPDRVDYSLSTAARITLGPYEQTIDEGGAAEQEFTFETGDSNNTDESGVIPTEDVPPPAELLDEGPFRSAANSTTLSEASPD
ncbi:MAG: TolC family protein [Planctomycetales bacterium]|nr:TolC family protein [Planctomycetales bacterium]